MKRPRMKRTPKGQLNGQHQPWCAIHLPSIRRCDWRTPTMILIHNPRVKAEGWWRAGRWSSTALV